MVRYVETPKPSVVHYSQRNDNVTFKREKFENANGNSGYYIFQWHLKLNIFQ